MLQKFESPAISTFHMTWFSNQRKIQGARGRRPRYEPGQLSKGHIIKDIIGHVKNVYLYYRANLSLL